MRESITIRPAEPRDIETITQFNVAMARETEDKRLSVPVVARGVQSLLDNPKYGFYVVAEVEGRVVGSLMVTYEWSDWRGMDIWWLQSIYVSKKWRRKGIMKMLIEKIKKMAGNNVFALRLYVHEGNGNAIEAYKKVGMKKMPYFIFSMEM